MRGDDVERSALQEFDPSQDSVVHPRPPQLDEPLPQRVVLCFFPEVLAALDHDPAVRRIGAFSEEVMGGAIYAVEQDGHQVAITHPGMGGPLAAHRLEQLIAAGGRGFVVCGSAGALRPDLTMGAVVVPEAAVRDEGTSFHYATPSRHIAADPTSVAIARQVLVEAGVPYQIGLTWTTDADYRETAAKVDARRAEGCLTVEMEAASLFAVAAFRQVALAQYLYAADDLSGPVWSSREWTSSPARQLLTDLALRAAVRLHFGSAAGSSSVPVRRRSTDRSATVTEPPPEKELATLRSWSWVDARRKRR